MTPSKKLVPGLGKGKRYSRFLLDAALQMFATTSLDLSDVNRGMVTHAQPPKATNNLITCMLDTPSQQSILASLQVCHLPPPDRRALCSFFRSRILERHQQNTHTNKTILKRQLRQLRQHHPAQQSFGGPIRYPHRFRLFLCKIRRSLSSPLLQRKAHVYQQHLLHLPCKQKVYPKHPNTFSSSALTGLGMSSDILNKELGLREISSNTGDKSKLGSKLLTSEGRLGLSATIGRALVAENVLSNPLL